MLGELVPQGVLPRPYAVRHSAAVRSVRLQADQLGPAKSRTLLPVIHVSEGSSERSCVRSVRLQADLERSRFGTNSVTHASVWPWICPKSLLKVLLVLPIHVV